MRFKQASRQAARHACLTVICLLRLQRCQQVAEVTRILSKAFHHDCFLMGQSSRLFLHAMSIRMGSVP